METVESHMNKVDQSIIKYRKTGSLLCLNTEELSYLPKGFLESYASHQIHLVWEKLPEKYKKDSDLQIYRKCIEHSNYFNKKYGDVLDGYYPLRKHCELCIKKK